MGAANGARESIILAKTAHNAWLARPASNTLSFVLMSRPDKLTEIQELAEILRQRLEVGRWPATVTEIEQQIMPQQEQIDYQDAKAKAGYKHRNIVADIVVERGVLQGWANLEEGDDLKDS